MNEFKKMIMADNQGFFLPKEYIELDYIESPSVNGYGKCLIETGISYRNKIIQATIQGNTSQANTYTIAFGGFQDFTATALVAYKDESIGYSLNKSVASGIPIDKKVDVTLTVKIDPDDIPSSDNKVKVIGTMRIGDIEKTRSLNIQLADNTIFLFSGGSSDSNSLWNFVGKIFKCKITELDGKVLRYFIPALRVSDSIAGMYDVISGRFFTNPYSNKFEYGL